MAGESKRVVIVAGVANLVIAVAKLVGGLLSGSVAMLAEAAHSIGDTVNEIFLYVSLDLGARPADERHPFGYGKERFFWAFLAAVFIFVAGAVFSLIEGVRALLSPSEETDYLIAYVVLAVALISESTSLVKAVRHVRGEAHAEGRSIRQHLRQSKDPTVKVVVFEDTAAVAGVLIAAAAIGIHQATGDGRWDGVGSIVIGGLLTFVAFRLGRDAKDLLIGSAALPEERDAILKAVEAHDEVDQVLELLTMAVGPKDLLVAVRADFRDDVSSDRLEAAASQIERDVRASVPHVAHFFLDPTKMLDRERSHLPLTDTDPPEAFGGLPAADPAAARPEHRPG